MIGYVGDTGLGISQTIYKPYEPPTGYFETYIENMFVRYSLMILFLQLWVMCRLRRAPTLARDSAFSEGRPWSVNTTLQWSGMSHCQR